MHLYQEKKVLSNAFGLKGINFKTNTKGDRNCRKFVIQPHLMGRNCEGIMCLYLYPNIQEEGKMKWDLQIFHLIDTALLYSTLLCSNYTIAN